MKKDNPFEKEVNYYYPTAQEKPVAKQQAPIKEPVQEPARPKDVEKWEKDANAYLEHNNIPKRVINMDGHDEIYDSRWHNFLIVFFLIAVVAFMAFAGWGIYNDKFKTVFYDNSTVVCEAPIIPECPIAPACPSCPSLSCGNVTVQIPDNLQITFENNLTGGNESD